MFRKTAARILSLSLCFPAFPGNSQSPQAAPPATAVSAKPEVRTDGSGGSSIETFLPDLYVGLPKLQLPLLLPPLRSSLSVAFNVALGQQGVLGHGWVLPIPHISRSKRRGITYAGREFTLDASSGTGDLVEITANRFKLVADDKSPTVESRGDYFVLKNRDGSTSVFGQTPTSRLHDSSGKRVFSWSVDKVVDRHGSVAVFQYENINGVPYIKNIRYGSSNVLRLPFELAFSYDQDSLSPTVFEFDFPTRNERLLRTIRVSMFGRFSRSYEFAYVGMPETGTYLLESVVEKATTDENPHRYALQYTPSSALESAPLWMGGPSPGVPVGNQCLTGDFNGDGRTDLACYVGGDNWQMALSTGSGWSAPLWTGGPSPSVPVGNQCLTGDFNGDGKTDLACYAGGDNWQMGLSTGSGWSAPMWTNGPAPGVPVGNKCLAGDFNGDGKTDLACYTGSGGNWHMTQSTGSGWSASLWTGGPSPDEPVGNKCLTGDFNGDGKTDLACYASGGNWQMGLSTGSGWNAPMWTSGPSPGVPVRNRCLTGDFNGDGKTDLVCYSGGAANWQMALSTGSGWSAPPWTGGPSPAVPVGNHCLTGNFNGDGTTDLACYGGGGNWHMWLSRKSATYALSKISFPTGLSVQYEYEWTEKGTLRFLPSVFPDQEQPK
jgi:hypothetical protein